MRIGIIGAGKIGGGLARLLSRAGHDLLVSFSRDPEGLVRLAEEVGGRAGSPAEAAAHGEVVVLSVPWALVDDAVEQAGGPSALRGVVLDTTNPYGPRGWEAPEGGLTSTQLNQRRLPEARVVKAFNTLTAGFQASAAGRAGDDRVVVFLAGDDPDARATVSGLVRDAGFHAVELGTAADSTVMEAPRRPGAVYGEEYHLADAEAVAAAVRAGRPVPPTPDHRPG